MVGGVVPSTFVSFSSLSVSCCFKELMRGGQDRWPLSVSLPEHGQLSTDINDAVQL